MKWLIYTRGTIHLFRLDPALNGMYTTNVKDKGYPYFNLLYYHKRDKLWFCWGEKEIKDFGKYMLEKFDNKNKYERHIKWQEDISKKAIKYSDKILRQNLSKCSNLELSKKFEHLENEFAPPHIITGFDIDVFDVVFDKFLLKKISSELRRKGIEERKISDLCQKISIPACQTYLNREQIAILKVALNDAKKEDIEKIYKKYWWTSLGWENTIARVCKYFENQVKKEIKKGDLEKRIKEKINLVPKTRRERKRLLNKYKLSKDIKYWLEVADRYTAFHDLRKEMQVRTLYSSSYLLKEVSKRLSFTIEELEWLWIHEIVSLLRGDEINKDLIKQREKALLVIIDKKGIKEWVGDKAIRRGNKEVKQNIGDVKIVKGQIAQKGKVKGVARVCSGAQEALIKVKKGDVLVCGMTLPDYVPAMKRAAAIVTDEGGITSHAAIISRELKIPCIIGTKIATQVLKDGDKIEVDAYKGEIKILKNKK